MVSTRGPHEPACDCCPHILNEELERDELLLEVWECCPDSNCLWEMCAECDPLGPARKLRESRDNAVLKRVVDLESQ